MQKFSLLFLCASLLACETRRESPKNVVSVQKKEEPKSIKAAPSCLYGLESECKEACEQSDLDACTTLGRMYLSGIVANAKPREAKALLEKSCDGGRARACSSLGGAYLSNEDAIDVPLLPRDLDKALALFQKACAQNDAVGCLELSFFYETGGGITKDLAKASELVQQSIKSLSAACDAGDGDSCFRVGDAYARSVGLSLKHDQSKADSYFDKALTIYQGECNSGRFASCFDLAQTQEERSKKEALSTYQALCDKGYGMACYAASDIYRAGILVTEDAEAAAKSFAKALPMLEASCKVGDLFSCALLGLEYDRGVYMAKDEAKWLSYMEASCRGGFSLACLEASDAYSLGLGVPEDYKKAREILAPSCEWGDAESCQLMALNFEDETPPDTAQAITFYKKARDIMQKECEFGLAEECRRLGDAFMDELPKDEAKATAYYGKALSLLQERCAADFGAECHEIADMMASGVGVARSVDTAADLYAKNCDGGHYESCASLGDIYRDGSSALVEDREKAKALYKKACDQDNYTGCERLCGLGDEDGCRRAK